MLGEEQERQRRLPDCCLLFFFLILNFNTFTQLDFSFPDFSPPFPHLPTTEAEHKKTLHFMKHMLWIAHVPFWLEHLRVSRTLTCVTGWIIILWLHLLCRHLVNYDNKTLQWDSHRPSKNWPRFGWAGKKYIHFLAVSYLLPRSTNSSLGMEV